MKRIDVTGQTFERLTVKSMFYESGKDSKALCSCTCGNEVISLVYNLRNGNTKSCGCFSREVRAERWRVIGTIQGKKNATHGMSKTPTYISWIDARKRCFRESDTHYSSYGGRGITMCAAWNNSFEAFIKDMGEAPCGLTLDRIDVDGNYEPSNCRWVTKIEQAQNTRANKATWPIVLEMRRRHAAGEKTADLAREFGMCWSNAKYIASGVTWKDVSALAVQNRAAADNKWPHGWTRAAPE